MIKRLASFFFLAYILILATHLLGQESRQKLYRIYISEPEKIKALSQQGYDIYHIEPGQYVEVMTYPSNIELLKKQELKTEFIAHSFKELLERELGSDLSEYHDYETTYQELTQISQTYPQITKLDTIGISVENRVIGVLKVSDNPTIDEDEPPLLIVGVHHGDEILNIEVVLHIIQFLVDNYGSDPEVTDWVNNLEMWFIPLVNPDGREHLTRYNSHGVDLNRNYSFQFTPGGSHGAEPFSEPETRTIRDFAATHPPILSLTYHSAGRYVLYPWTHTDRSAPDNFLLQQIGGIIADSLNYTLRQSGDWYFTAGEYTDFMYGVHGTVAFTIETYTSHQAPASVIDYVVNRNLPGFIALLKHVNQSGLTGLIRDAYADTAIEATIDILEIDDQGLLFPRKPESLFGRFYRYLVPGNYTVTVSAPDFQTVTFSAVPVSLDSLTLLNVNLQPTASIAFDGFEIDDDSIGNSWGNGDGLFNINETIGLPFTIVNHLPNEARNVYAMLTSRSEYVEFISDSVFFGNLEPNAPAASADIFLVYIVPSCPDGKIIAFKVTIRDSAGAEWQYPFSAKVFAPQIALNQVIVHDFKGDENGILNNGETARIELKIKNMGHLAVNQLIASLSSDDSYIQIIQNTDQLSFLDIQQDSSLTFDVKLNEDAPNIHLINFKLEFSSAEGYAGEVFFQLYNVNGLYDNFEYQNLNWTHDSWNVTSNHHDDWQWGTPQGKAGDPSAAYSGEKCWGTDLGYDDCAGQVWDGFYENYVFNYLKSPTFNCSGLTQAGLKFQRWLNILPGDIARIKVNNSIAWMSPPEGVQDDQWTEQLIDISALADDNQAVTILFELFAKNNGRAGGWNIDDVLVTGDLISKVADSSPAATPKAYRLFDNYPNPFNPTTRIVYAIPSRQHVELTIIDVLGRTVKTLIFKQQEAGSYQVSWDGTDQFGSMVSSGVYFYRLKAGELVETKKLLFLK